MALLSSLLLNSSGVCIVSMLIRIVLLVVMLRLLLVLVPNLVILVLLSRKRLVLTSVLVLLLVMTNRRIPWRILFIKNLGLVLLIWMRKLLENFVTSSSVVFVDLRSILLISANYFCKNGRLPKRKLFSHSFSNFE